MYQVIDDPEEENRYESGFSIWPFLIGAVLAGIVFFFVWVMSPGSQTQPGETIETPLARAEYLKAISEPTPALRRARLLDYQRAYPETDRGYAIADQLEVIQRTELADWEKLTAKVYDVRADADEKREALIEYETKWNRALLGGRGEELDVLTTEIDETAAAQPLPDRNLKNVESPIPETLPSDTLAGAPPRFEQPVYIPPPPKETAPIVKDVIIQPKVRRNVSPNYPRKAHRRKVDAIVVIAMNINAKGRVEMTEVISIEAERYERDFIKAAERAALRTRFHPKTINGKPVPAVGVRKRYIFRAED